MATVISTAARDDLRDRMREWARLHVKANSLEEAERAAEEVQRVAGETILEAALVEATGKGTYKGASIACSCGERSRFHDYRARWIKSVSGEARIERSYYYCSACKRATAPWDVEQGLNKRVYSPRLKALVSRVMGRMPYGEGVGLLSELGIVELEISSAEDIVAEVGERVRSEEERRLEALRAAREKSLSCRLLCEDEDAKQEELFAVRPVSGTRVYVEADAAKGHIDGGWHDVKVGVFTSVRKNADGIDTPDARRYVAGRRTAEEFGWMLSLGSAEWNVDAYAEVVYLADGARSLWDQAERHFPKAVQILDYYHASENLWTLGRALYRQEDAAEKTRGDRWVKDRLASLLKDGPAPLLRALNRRRGRTEAQREALRQARGYFGTNRHRMDYAAYRAAGMMIGSGLIEAGCKVVVGQRLKQAGMRWSNTGADNILAIRSRLLSSDSSILDAMARAA